MALFKQFNDDFAVYRQLLPLLNNYQDVYVSLMGDAYIECLIPFPISMPSWTPRIKSPIPCNNLVTREL